MAYEARISESTYGPSEPQIELPANTPLAPVSLLDCIAAWLATAGILIVLAGGVVIASLVWFVTLAFTGAAPDEAVGEESVIAE